MPSWDLLDETFTNLDDWTNQDNDTGESEISPAGELRLDTNAGAAGGIAYAQQYQDIGAYPDAFTVEIETYFDLIGTIAAGDHFRLDMRQAAERFAFLFGTAGLVVEDDGGDIEIGTNLVASGGAAKTQLWRFLISCAGTSAATCDAYLYDSTYNWEKIGTSVDCSIAAAYNDGTTLLTQFGYTTDNMVSHVRYIRALTGLYAVYPSELEFCKGSIAIPKSGIRIDYASNGDPHGQILHSSDRQGFRLIHRAINLTNKAILDDFYTTNKALESTLPWIDDVGYNCIFADAPKYTPLGASLFDVEVNFVQKDE